MSSNDFVERPEGKKKPPQFGKTEKAVETMSPLPVRAGYRDSLGA